MILHRASDVCKRQISAQPSSSHKYIKAQDSNEEHDGLEIREEWLTTVLRVRRLKRKYMSSKHDADNRSNQLNSNNDAYQSSRSGNPGRDDDDEGRSTAGVGGPNYLSIDFRALLSTSMATDKPAQREGFTFDFVSLSGGVALLEMTAELDPSLVYQGDCTDIAEHMFNKLRLAFLKECGSAIAFSQLKSADGKIIDGVGQEFYPAAFYLSSETGEYLSNKKLWETTGKLAVEKLRGQLKNGSHKPRENLGVINAKQLLGYRYGR